MTAINYVTNEKGEKTALLVDFKKLKKAGKTGRDVVEFLEDLDDIIEVELSKGQKGKPYNKVRKEIMGKK